MSINLADVKIPADVEAAIERDPLAFIFAVWDAESETDAEAAAWERVIVDFAKRERIKPEPFRYIGDRPPILQRKPWLYFGRNWPYCFMRIKDDAWVPLGRQYKPLGEEQFRGDFFDYNEFAHAAWRFIDDPATFGEDVWTCADAGGQLWLYNDNPASRRDYFARVGRLIALTDDPIKYVRRLTWRDDPPPSDTDVALAA